MQHKMTELYRHMVNVGIDPGILRNEIVATNQLTGTLTGTIAGSKVNPPVDMSRYLPAWAVEANSTRLTPAGILFLRLAYRAITSGKLGEGARWTNRSDGLFSMPNLTVMHVTILDDKAVVYVVLDDGNKPLLVEDDHDLFPSDGLIARLKLLEKK